MSRPVPLDLLFPRPVLVSLAGQPYKASELTLGDLAQLQSWLRQAAPHPLASIPPPWDDPEPDTRRRRLVAAWHAAKSWPPRLGSDDDRDYLDSPEGRAVFLVLVLGRWDEGFTAEDAHALASSMDADDWTRLRRIAWGIPPWRELAAEIDPDWAVEQARKAASETEWGEVVASVMKAFPGLDFATIAGWTPTQLNLLCSGGTLPEYRAVMRRGESRDEFASRMKALFALTPAPSSPPGPVGGSPSG